LLPNEFFLSQNTPKSDVGWGLGEWREGLGEERGKGRMGKGEEKGGVGGIVPSLLGR